MTLTQLNKVFTVEYGNKFDMNKMTAARDGEVAFVGRSGVRNGIAAYVHRIELTEPYPAGAITVALGGAILSSFVQPKPFYTGQNVAVLIPLSEMSFDEKMYYCLCIQANRHRYGAFGREANRTLRTLPIPDRRSIPKWVNGATTRSLEEIKTDLTNLALQES